jgi:hypothetical protein
MFVRWQQRKRKSRAFGGSGIDTHWAAILAQSTRVDGKPVQRHIAYLGGIRDSAIESQKTPAQRAYFWNDVTLQLDQLSNRVSKDDRARIEAALEKKVPRLTRKEYDAWAAYREGSEFYFGELPSFEVCGRPARRAAQSR